MMFKKVSAFVLLALVFVSAFAEAPVGYSAILSADNPVPDIADRVRPAVVQVFCDTETWDPVTRIADTEEVGSASGCYFMADEENGGGYILTNNHVIDKGEVYTIEWLDGTEMDATLVGQDDGTDIAILRFSEAVPEGVVPIPMGDSDALRIGELAICIGHPGANDETLVGTVTVGIVSGLQRENINADNFTRGVSVIQTDAAINTGNSGGAMLNAKGELVGIPTLKFMASSTIVYEGLGFCIPINAIKDYINQILTSGSVVRPRLGITVGNNDGPDDPMKKYPPIGAQVFTVEEGGPSAAAGMQVGDIITEINGIRIETYNELLREIDKCSAGDTVELKVYRYYDKDGNLTGSFEELYFSIKLELLK